MTAQTDQKPSLATIFRAAGPPIALAIIVNVVLFFVGSALGWFPDDVLTPFGAPITVVPVVVSTAITTIIGTLVYFVLTRFLDKARANLWFLILASIVLIFMAYNPTTLLGASIGQIVMLQIMHVVAGLPLMYTLIRI